MGDFSGVKYICWDSLKIEGKRVLCVACVRLCIFMFLECNEGLEGCVFCLDSGTYIP